MRLTAIVSIKFKTGNAAICRDILILFTNRLLQNIQFNFTGKACQFIQAKATGGDEQTTP